MGLNFNLKRVIKNFSQMAISLVNLAMLRTFEGNFAAKFDLQVSRLQQNFQTVIYFAPHCRCRVSCFYCVVYVKDERLEIHISAN